jgi:hypothetical protein
MRTLRLALLATLLVVGLAGCGGRCGIFDKGYPLCGL